jgi:20S proteasome alpha/beta subunit
MIYGIDFDGTIVEEKFPAIGKPNTVVVDFIRN